MHSANIYHIDVFATAPLTGNGLTVFLNADGWTAQAMQALTREMKQFESIFLTDISTTGAHARVFTMDEELPFAGHPLLGAAAVLHRTQAPDVATANWVISVPAGDLALITHQRGTHFAVEMNQGVATCGTVIEPGALVEILGALSLNARDLVTGLNAQVVSTGLPYLILPVDTQALARAKIVSVHLEEMLARLGAKFVLIFDVAKHEMRTWDNQGHFEDVATGSAAGPAAAYLFNHQIADRDQPLELAQGRFAQRPSKLHVRCDGGGNLFVSGEVWPVTHGVLEVEKRTLGS